MVGLFIRESFGRTTWKYEKEGWAYSPGYQSQIANSQKHASEGHLLLQKQLAIDSTSWSPQSPSNLENSRWKSFSGYWQYHIGLQPFFLLQIFHSQPLTDQQLQVNFYHLFSVSNSMVTLPIVLLCLSLMQVSVSTSKSKPTTTTTGLSSSSDIRFCLVHFLLSSQRNVVYRLIHRKIPTMAILSRFVLSNLYPSNICRICNIGIEDQCHFLFFCPAKTNIWKRIMFVQTSKTTRWKSSLHPNIIIITIFFSYSSLYIYSS